MEAQGHMKMQKCLITNQHTSGAAGDYIPGQTKRQHQQRLFDNMVWSIGENCYLVSFDNGEEKELSSSVLKIENIIAALPPDALLPVPQSIQEERMLEDATAEELPEDNKEADLPTQLPDSDEAEVELELQFAAKEEANPGTSNPDAYNPVEEEANNNTTNEADVHGRMPGQLPTVADVVENDNTTRDCATVKWLAMERIAALLGTTVTVAAAHRNSITWKVVDKHVPPEERIVEAGFEQKKQFGITDRCWAV
jgi:hypothetical protein